MSQPSRNRPCPCGSGRKYKKCCLPPQEQSPEIAPGLSMKDLPPGSRIVEKNGQTYLLSEGLDESVLDIVDSHYKGQSIEAIKPGIFSRLLGMVKDGNVT